MAFKDNNRPAPEENVIIEPNESDSNDDEIEEDFVHMSDEEVEVEQEDEEAEYIEREDMAKITFEKHNEPVLSCHLSKDGQWAVTGGQDDIAYVWSTSTGEIKIKCDEHDDSIDCVGFNSDSKLVFTGDMNGKVRVWSMETGLYVGGHEFSGLQFVRWHPVVPNILIGGDSTGTTCLFKINSNDHFKFMTGPDECVLGEFLPGGKQFVVLYKNGTLRIWDLVTAQSLVSLEPNRKSSKFCSLAVRDDGLIACGYVDGCVALISSKSNKVIWKFYIENLNPEKVEDSEEHSVEALCFVESLNFLATGSVDGAVEIWDLGAKVKRLEVHVPEGVSKMKIHKDYPLHLFVAGLDGVAYVYDVRNGHLLYSFTGHINSLLDFDVNMEQNRLLTTSDDSTAKIFELNFDT